MRIIIFLLIFGNISFNYAKKQGSSAYYTAISNAISGSYIYDEAAIEIINSFRHIWHPELQFDTVSHDHRNYKREVNHELMTDNFFFSQFINDKLFPIFPLLPGSDSAKKYSVSPYSFFNSAKTFLPNLFSYLNTSNSLVSTNSSSILNLFSKEPSNSSSSVSSLIINFSSATSSISNSSATSAISKLSITSTISHSSATFPLSNSSATSPLSITSSISPLSNSSATFPLSNSSSTSPLSNSSAISPISNSSVTFPISNSSSSASYTTLNSSLSSVQTTLPTVQPENTCFADLKDIGKALWLSSNYTWVIKMLDSFGKPSSGISQGAVDWYGSYDECFIHVPADERPDQNLGSLEGKYCLASFSTSNETKAWSTLFKSGVTVKEGLCVPSSCSEDYLQDLLNFILKYTINQIPKLKNLRVTEVTCPPRSQSLDTRAIGVLFLISVFLVLMFLGTCYDLIVHRQYVNYSLKSYFKLTDDKSENDQNQSGIIENGYINNDNNLTSNQPGIIGKILLSFSVYSNAEKILNLDQSEGTLSCIHGIRFLSLSWVILGHTYIYGAANFSDPLNFIPFMDKFFFQAVENAFVSVDTFFLLSGTLVSYTFMKMYAAGKISWVAFYLHRFWRLTSPYMLILGTYVALMKYLGNGPLWKTDGIEINYCANSWWYNLLYINNFGTYDEMCMGWTWYLANDMQFYIISPFILMLLVRNKLFGFLLIGVLMLGTWITSGIISTVYNLPASPGLLNGDNISLYMEKLYVKPYCRIGPYLIGIILGYILYTTKCKYIFKSKWIPLLGWCVAIIMNMSIVYGLVNSIDNQPMSNELNALYNSLNRTGWAIGVSWVIFTCVTGYAGFVNTILSWKFWIPLSRLTYCAYLIHPIMMYIFCYNEKSLFMFSQYLMVYLFLANLVIAFAVAFVLSLAFESPMMGLEKLLLSRNKRTD